MGRSGGWRGDGDSRLATLNSLFVAIDGAAVSGATFMPQAVAKGADVVMSHHAPIR